MQTSILLAKNLGESGHSGAFARVAIYLEYLAVVVILPLVVASFYRFRRWFRDVDFDAFAMAPIIRATVLLSESIAKLIAVTNAAENRSVAIVLAIRATSWISSRAVRASRQARIIGHTIHDRHHNEENSAC